MNGFRPHRSVLKAYLQQVEDGIIQQDPAQLLILHDLECMATALRKPVSGRWFGFQFSKARAVPGMYLFGKVGRGKTFLTELFLSSIDDVSQQRWHFHRFMNHVHQQLALMPNTADTVSVFAKALSKQCRVLVLDEFFVSDIADAMILYRLIDQLTVNGVSFICTSNVPPDELYLNGLQRESFLPCIALLKQQCRIVELQSRHDYRLRTLCHASTYLTPDTTEAEQLLQQQYIKLTGQNPFAGEIEINSRFIETQGMASGVIWMHFNAICEGPRSAADYVEIARDFHTVLLSHVPRFEANSEDAARRFVYLIDELYDRRVNVLLSASVEPTALYQGQRLQREFERTRSRLIEMQSTDYLALAHRP